RNIGAARAAVSAFMMAGADGGWACMFGCTVPDWGNVSLVQAAPLLVGTWPSPVAFQPAPCCSGARLAPASGTWLKPPVGWSTRAAGKPRAEVAAMGSSAWLECGMGWSAFVTGSLMPVPVVLVVAVVAMGSCGRPTAGEGWSRLAADTFG